MEYIASYTFTCIQLIGSYDVINIVSLHSGWLDHRELLVVPEYEAALSMPGKCCTTERHSHTVENSSVKTLGSLHLGRLPFSETGCIPLR